jgi:hypothetical protein
MKEVYLIHLKEGSTRRDTELIRKNNLLMKPKPRKRKKRTLGDAIQDVKQNIRARKGSRKIKKTMKDSAEKSSKVTRDRRGERRERLEDKASQKNVYGKARIPRKKRKELEEVGVHVGKKTSRFKEPASKKRAKRTLGRMDEQDKRRVRRKVK